MVTQCYTILLCRGINNMVHINASMILISYRHQAAELAGIDAKTSLHRPHRFFPLQRTGIVSSIQYHSKEQSEHDTVLLFHPFVCDQFPYSQGIDQCSGWSVRCLAGTVEE